MKADEVDLLLLLLQIRIFDLGKCQGYKCIHKFDVGKEMEKQSSVSSRQLVSSCMLHTGLYSRSLSDSFAYLALSGCAVADSSANPQWKQHNSVSFT